MRLVCPNCEAKYEVPEDAIPETGRDVQCANCGHSWYQMRPRAAVPEAPVAAAPASAAAAEVPVEAAAPLPESEPEVVAEVAAPADPAPIEAAAPSDETTSVAEVAPVSDAAPVIEPTVPFGEEEQPLAGPQHDAASHPEADDIVADPAAAVVDAPLVAETGPDPVPEHDDTPSALPAAATVAAGAAAYAVDDSVLAILREEAEREAKARKAEAAKPLETQTELGIDQAMPAINLPHQPVYEDTALAARRARLPDVEEINSTLRPAETMDDGTATDTMPVASEGRSSFRSGFLIVLTVAILGSAVYGSADAIAEAVPALAGVLKSYVGFVDSLRLQLDGLMQSATVAINGT